jgi:hypothetical protein
MAQDGSVLSAYKGYSTDIRGQTPCKKSKARGTRPQAREKTETNEGAGLTFFLDHLVQLAKWGVTGSGLVCCKKTLTIRLS